MRALGKTIGILLLLLIAAALLSGSIQLLTKDRDADGFFVSGANRLETPSFAIVEEPGILDIAPSWLVGWFSDVVDVRVAATSSTGNEVFLGVGPEGDVQAYLADVAYDELTGLDLDPVKTEYQSRTGEAEPTPPGDEAFWVVSAEGPGQQTVTWDLEPGEWAGVLMNADAARGVSVDLVAGWKLNNATAWMWGTFAAGVVLVLLALWAIVHWIRRGAKRRAQEQMAGPQS
jgi:hypothetical protein